MSTGVMGSSELGPAAAFTLTAPASNGVVTETAHLCTLGRIFKKIPVAVKPKDLERYMLHGTTLQYTVLVPELDGKFLPTRTPSSGRVVGDVWLWSGPNFEKYYIPVFLIEEKP